MTQSIVEKLQFVSDNMYYLRSKMEDAEITRRDFDRAMEDAIAEVNSIIGVIADSIEELS